MHALVRAARMAGRRGLTIAAATECNAARDAARQRYVRANFGTDATAPEAYDLVVNIAQVPLPLLLRMVIELVAARVPASSA